MNRGHLLWVCAVIVVLAVVPGMRCLQSRLAMGCGAPVDKRLVTANTSFAIRLFKEVAAEQPNHNMLWA